jgi:prepilin-type processing-associated H-X9-DG protein
MERGAVRALDGRRPEQAGVLYIDGHVRVYNGSQTPAIPAAPGMSGDDGHASAVQISRRREAVSV